MANWFQPYLVPRDAWASLRYSEALAVEIEDRLVARFGNPWSSQEHGCGPPPPSWCEAVQAVLQRSQDCILQRDYLVLVAVAFVIVEKLSIQGEDLGVLRHSELPGLPGELPGVPGSAAGFYPPAIFLPDVRILQHPDDWFYLAFLRDSDIVSEIGRTKVELRDWPAKKHPVFNAGLKRYESWLRAAQTRGVFLAITFS